MGQGILIPISGVEKERGFQKFILNSIVFFLEFILPIRPSQEL